MSWKETEETSLKWASLLALISIKRLPGHTILDKPLTSLCPSHFFWRGDIGCHAEDPRPGIKPTPQEKPKLSSDNDRPLTH